MKWTLIGVSIALGLAHSALAQDAERIARMDNVQAQLSVCVAYYSLELKCQDGATDRPLRLLIERSDAAAKAAMMSSADVAMRLEFNLTMQRSLIEDSCGKFARLSARHWDECEPWLATGGPK
jgi:hypothetical protein